MDRLIKNQIKCKLWNRLIKMTVKQMEFEGPSYKNAAILYINTQRDKEGADANAEKGQRSI